MIPLEISSEANTFQIKGRGMVIAINQSNYLPHIFAVGDKISFKGKNYIVRFIECHRNLFNGRIMEGIGLGVREI